MENEAKEVAYETHADNIIKGMQALTVTGQTSMFGGMFTDESTGKNGEDKYYQMFHIEDKLYQITIEVYAPNGRQRVKLDCVDFKGMRPILVKLLEVADKHLPIENVMCPGGDKNCECLEWKHTYTHHYSGPNRAVYTIRLVISK